MADEPEHKEKSFWVGQNIWVVLGGAGIFLIPEHLVYGSICTVAGLLAFLYSIRERGMKFSQNVTWTIAILLTWGGIGYDYYDRHHPTSVTTSNITQKLREWSDAFNLSVAVLPEDPTRYFTIAVRLPNDRPIIINRPKKQGADKYLTLQSTMSLTPLERNILSGLSDEKAKSVLEQIELEVARSKVGFEIKGQNAKSVTAIILSKGIPITKGLTENVFLDELNDLDNASTILSNVIMLSVDNLQQNKP